VVDGVFQRNTRAKMVGSEDAHHELGRAQGDIFEIAGGAIDMCCTCLYADNMSKMIQVRDVPERVHGILKARAAREGMSLSDFLKRDLERAAERPTMREWLERTEQAKAIPSKRSAAQIVRELRDGR
jgi:antitoxin FitA